MKRTPISSVNDKSVEDAMVETDVSARERRTTLLRYHHSSGNNSFNSDFSF